MLFIFGLHPHTELTHWDYIQPFSSFVIQSEETSSHPDPLTPSMAIDVDWGTHNTGGRNGGLGHLPMWFAFLLYPDPRCITSFYNGLLLGLLNLITLWV